MKVGLKIPLKTCSFDLKDVKLLDSQFKEHQELNEKWLRSFTNDQLLLAFKVNTGMRAEVRNGAPILRGWEALNEEVRGHTMGHTLSALALTYASTGDDYYKKRGDDLVRELAVIQETMNQGGYLSAFPERLIDRAIERIKVWVPWYTLHKIVAGLEDQYLYADNEQALQVARKMGDWACEERPESGTTGPHVKDRIWWNRGIFL
jgi:DUF1680 family protein